MTGPAGKNIGISRAARNFGRIFLSLPFLLTVYAVICFYPFQLVSEGLTSGADGASYLSHALTIGLDFDLDYQNEPTLSFNKDKTIARHPVGSGVMAAPFVFLFSMADRLIEHPVIENHKNFLYSFSTAGFVFASNFYFLSGLWLYFLGCRKMTPEIGKKEFLLLLLSAGVAHYALYNGIMSHAFEFFSCALAFYAAAAICFDKKSPGKSAFPIFLCALSVLLNLAVRISNLNTIFLPQLLLLAFWIFSGAASSAGPAEKKNILIYFLSIFILCIVAAIPLGIFNNHFYGGLYPTVEKMYDHKIHGFSDTTFLNKIERLLSLAPNIFPLLFSSEMGLLYSNPVIPFGFLFSLILLSKSRPGPFYGLVFIGGLVLYAGFSVAVVLWWRTTASAYGYRYLFPLLPVCLAGVLYWKKRFWAKERRGISAWVYIVFLAFCVNAMASHVFFGATEKLSPRPEVNVYGVHHRFSVRHYQTDLLKSLFTVETYRNLIAKRYIGFVASDAVMNTELKDLVPRSFVEKYDAYYRDVPWYVHVQAASILLLWVAWGFWYQAARPTPGGKTLQTLCGIEPEKNAESCSPSRPCRS